PAGQHEQLAQRGAEVHLVHARRVHRAGDAEQLRAGGAPRPDRGERGTADREDLQDVVERLHVVDDRGPSEQAADARERRLVARLAAVALDRVEQRGLLAADVRAGAAAQLYVEREAGPEHVGAEEAAGPGGRDRDLQPPG